MSQTKGKMKKDKNGKDLGWEVPAAKTEEALVGTGGNRGMANKITALSNRVGTLETNNESLMEQVEALTKAVSDLEDVVCGPDEPAEGETVDDEGENEPTNDPK